MLAQHLLWVWQAFTDLSYRRSSGFGGPLPISYSDILAYCHLKGIKTAEEKERLTRFVDALDKVFMAEAYKDVESNKSPPPQRAEAHRHDVPRHKRRPPTQEMKF